MKELLLYITTIKEIIDRHYGKGIVFYEEGVGWYSRYHSEYITDEKLVEWLLEITQTNETDE